MMVELTGPPLISPLKKKILITGIDGQIGSYVKQEYNDHIVYGTTRADIIPELQDKVKMDVTDKIALEKLILEIKPDCIIHLASISSTIDCLKDPVKTLETNGMVAAVLCDIIHRNKLQTCLFNASSSEVYKGNKVHFISDNDPQLRPTHPYSIAKALSHHIVSWYRTTHNLPFSNGVIFTTESCNRKGDFLVKKCTDHARNFRKSKDVLRLGNLDSWRVFVHAKDAAKAIRLICDDLMTRTALLGVDPSRRGRDYNICNNTCLSSTKDFVMKIYEHLGIPLVEKEETFVDGNEDIVIKFNKLDQVRPDLSIDIHSIITGDNSHLMKLGWKPVDSIDELIEMILNV
jgi:GDP-D-mannose dehydratase